MPSWVKRHPIRSALASTFLTIAAAWPFAESLWSSFSDKPMIPAVYAIASDIFPHWPLTTVLAFWGLMSFLGIAFTIRIYLNTRTGEQITESSINVPVESPQRVQVQPLGSIADLDHAPQFKCEILSIELKDNKLLRVYRSHDWLITLRLRITIDQPVKLLGMWLVTNSDGLGTLQYLANGFRQQELPYSEIQTLNFNVAEEITNELFDFWVKVSIEGIAEPVISPKWKRTGFYSNEFEPA